MWDTKMETLGANWLENCYVDESMSATDWVSIGHSLSLSLSLSLFICALQRLCPSSLRLNFLRVPPVLVYHQMPKPTFGPVQRDTVFEALRKKIQLSHRRKN